MFDADIEAALASLPPDFRAAVVLCDVEGLTYEEIAGVLDLKMGTVRSRIHRGRAMLRTALAHRAPKDGRVRFAGPAARGAALTDDVARDPAAARPHRRPRQRARRRPALRGGGGARLGARHGLPRLPPAGRARGLAQDPARARCPTPTAEARPGLLGSLYDVDAWATVDEIERRGRTRRTAIAAVGAGSVGAAVLGLVAFTGPPAGLGERPPARQAPASVTADLAGVGASLGPATGVLRRHAK